MKKYLIIIGLAIIALTFLAPFASTTPDGLETLDEGSEAELSSWSGLIGDYTISVISNPLLSTIAAGIIGTVIVFLATFVLGAKISPKKKSETTKSL